MAEPLVDAVIAIHDPNRPIARAVRSLTASGLAVAKDGLRITVVCHNLAAGTVADALGDGLTSQVRLIEHHDGIRSPAGPFNAGVAAASARFVSIMGSDDYLEPGALHAWCDLADDSVDAVIAPQAHADGSTIRTPPVRPFRSGDRDALKDRLFYRTAPLGLVRRDAIDRLGLTLTEGLASGEDQAFSARLWVGSRATRYAARAPRYVVGADAESRVSMTYRPLREDLAFVERLIDDPWFAGLPVRTRRAIAVKIARIHLFAAVLARIDGTNWNDDEHASLAGLIERMRERAPGFERTLSLADDRVLSAVVEAGSSTERIASLSRARRRFGRPSTLLPSNPLSLLAADAPLRFIVASALL
ncbi:glycosyltransferase family 2 protein [Diaminobutyricibacter sp. McL0618]|uniref:glycosyltransferase family 2 protein n=1 Tax=Leifsonia sp. McL0618 TaxID=3415677 RepID=UPI003CFAAD4C